jgi:hypothetical protein
MKNARHEIRSVPACCVPHRLSAAVGKSGTIISSKRLLLWGGGINYDLAKTMEKLTEGDDLYGDVVINYLNRTACE